MYKAVHNFCVLSALFATISSCHGDCNCTIEQVCVQDSCYDKASYGLSCEFDDQCQATLGKNAACAGTVCGCFSGYTLINLTNRCQPSRHQYIWFIVIPFCAVTVFGCVLACSNGRRNQRLDFEPLLSPPISINYNTLADIPIRRESV